MVPSESAAAARICGCRLVSSRSATYVSTDAAPRVSRSLLTASSLLPLRATRKKLVPLGARRAQTAMAMPEVAPRIRKCEGEAFVSGIGRHALPECGVKGGIDIAGEIAPLRIRALVLRRRHACVLGGVHTAAIFHGDGSEPANQLEGYLPAQRKIEREGEP